MVDYEKRAMTDAEDKYTFRQSSQISGQCGLIGHLRAEMDTDGNGFFSSWFDYRPDLKTDEFKTVILRPKARCRPNRIITASEWTPKSTPIFCG